MTTRTYPRQQVEWDIRELDYLADDGRAVFFPADFPAYGTWVVTRPDGTSVAVRADQVVDPEAEAEAEAERGYERYLEDRGYWDARADEDYERSMGIF